MKYSKISLSLIFISMVYLLGGCSVVKKMAGADIDTEQFAKAREAKMYEIQAKSAANLADRMVKGDPLDKADVTCWLSEELLNKIASQYNSSTGFLDAETPYTIKSVDLKVHNGSSIASLALLARSNKYNVDVDLTMDCILTFELSGNDLALKLEPFNISPDVSAKGLLSSADEIIQNLIKINLANIGKSIPEIKIPLNISNRFDIHYSRTEIKNKVNLIVVNPERKIDYQLKIKEILFFEKKAYVALNVEKVEVK